MVREPRSRLGLALLAGCAVGLLVGAVLVVRTLVRCGRPILRHRPGHAVPAAGIRVVGSCLAPGRGGRQSAVSSRATGGLSHPTVDTLSQLIAPDADQPGLAASGRGAGRRYCVRDRARVSDSLLALAVIGAYIVARHRGGTGRRLVDRRPSSAAEPAELFSDALPPFSWPEEPRCSRAIALIDCARPIADDLVVTAMANAYGGELSRLASSPGRTRPSDMVVAYLTGVRACAWTLRTPSVASGAHDARTVRRRPRALTLLGEMLAVDRANVWRSTSLRRGLYVLGLLPGAVAALVGVRWVDLPLLPALVAAGAGMLFGVNAFCLDASGALWLASLPASPKATFLVRTITVLEVGLVTVAIATVAGSLRADRPIDPALSWRRVGCAVVRPDLGHSNVHAALDHPAAPSRATRLPRYTGATGGHGRLLRSSSRQGPPGSEWRSSWWRGSAIPSSSHCSASASCCGRLGL